MDCGTEGDRLIIFPLKFTGEKFIINNEGGEVMDRVIKVRTNSHLFEVEPGDGYRYSLLVTNLDFEEADLVPGATPAHKLVCLLNHSRVCYSLDFEYPFDESRISYIMEKFDLQEAVAKSFCLILERIRLYLGGQQWT
jgi:hypothetical protein